MPVVSYGGAEGVPFRQGGPRRAAVDPGQLWRQLLQLNARAHAATGMNNMFGITSDGKLFLTPDFIGQVGYRAQLNIANMLLQAVNASADQAITGARLIGEAILLEQADGTHLENANKVLAIEMRKALIARYGQSVEKRKQVPSYARSNRLSGALRRAISQPDMAIGTANGIQYINQDRLNTEARHWARINFGVQAAPGAKRGAARSTPPQQFELFGNKIGFTAKPRPPMYLPPGFWEFIGGRATAREERVGRVNQPDERDVTEKKQDRLAASAARRAARVNAALGKTAPTTTSSSSGGRFDSIKTGKGSYYRRNMSRTSGTSGWGVDYGGYPKSRTYERTYRTGGKNPFAQSSKKRTVTSVTRGIRRSRQAFRPVGRNAKYPTAGVVASNFMDAGFRALAQHADRVYANMANDIVEQATDEAARNRYKELRTRYNAAMEIEQLIGGKVHNKDLRGN